MGNCHFVVDEDFGDLDCIYGEMYEYDGTYVINLNKVDSINTLLGTIDHEELHLAIMETGHITTEKQDHFIIPRLLLM